MAAEVRDLTGPGHWPAIDGTNVQAIAEHITEQVIRRLALRLPGQPSQVPRTDGNLVFVISSFTREMEPIFEAISAAATTAGLHAERVKDIRGDYQITEKILAMIQQARFIVADLTHERPNVYFELGYAR